MRLGLFILFFLVYYCSIGQGLEPSQIQGSKRLNDILQAKNMYIDEYGDTLYVYQHTSLSGLRTDSIYLKNDTIYLRDGSGFVKIPASGGGSPQDLFPHSTGFILSNPTIPLQDTVIFQYTAGVISTPPSGCSCQISDIPNLQTTLDGKALVSHTHTIANITGLQAALDGKAATSHTHTIADVTGLQTALDGKEASFAKGNIVEGTGVTLTGTLTNRLVGSGDVTINASGGGGSSTLFENIKTTSTSLTGSMQTIATLTLASGTYLLNATLNGVVIANNINAEIFNSSDNIILARAGSSETIANIALVKVITVTGTKTIQLRASGNSNSLYSDSQGTQVLTALKIN